MPPTTTTTTTTSSTRRVRPTSVQATAREVAQTMPGDDLIASPRYRTTHAVDIDASPDRVWPWLAQLGQGRGGLYSYDWLENLVGCDMHSLDRVDPALQDPAVGDPVRLVPDGTRPPLRFVVAVIDPPHVLVLGPDRTRDAAFEAGLPFPAWTFQVDDRGVGGSRLVVRFQHDFSPTWWSRLAYQHALRPVHAVMERRMLLGIRDRAQATP